MQSFGWWLRKEVREHRVLLLLLALAVPLGSWLVVHREARSKDSGVSESHGGPPEDVVTPAGTVDPHDWHRDEWEFLLLVSAALAAALVAGGLFAGETRRGTAALMARTPGAWRAAFAAKLVFLALVLAGTLLLHAVVLGRLAAEYLLADGRGGLVDAWAVWPTDENVVAYGAIVAFATWLVLASVALPWIAVPALVGAVVGVGVAVPGILWTHQHPFFFRWWIGGTAWAVVGMAAVGLGIATLAWLRWDRVQRSTRYVGLRVGLLVLVSAAVANGAMWAAVSRYRAFDAHIPDLRLDDALMGVGDRFVYLHAYRGDPDAEPDSNDWYLYGTSPLPWRVDLDTGEWDACGAPDVNWYASSEASAYAMGTMPPVLLVLHDAPRDSESGTWFDATTGERLGRGEAYTPPFDASPRVRATFRTTARVRDSQGRRAWILDGHIEREGAEPMPVDVGERWSLREIPRGWASSAGSVGEGRLLRTIEADSGRVREYPGPGQTMVPAAVLGWWDPRHAVIRRLPASLGSTRDADATPLGSWELLDLETGTTAPLVADASPELAAAVPLARTGPDTLLLLRKGAGGAHLGRWTVGSPSVERAVWQGPELVGVEFAEAMLKGGHGTPMDDGAEPVLVKVRRAEPPGSASAKRRVEPWTAWALYDPGGNTLRAVRSWKSEWTSSDGALGIRADGSVLALEANRRIVRLGPQPGQREVLFPRR